MLVLFSNVGTILVLLQYIQSHLSQVQTIVQYSSYSSFQINTRHIYIGSVVIINQATGTVVTAISSDTVELASFESANESDKSQYWGWNRQTGRIESEVISYITIIAHQKVNTF